MTTHAEPLLPRAVEVVAWILFACLMALTVSCIWAELRDTAVYGAVYLWGADGSFNNGCGPNNGPCAFVNGLAVAQFVGFVSLILPVVVGIMTRRSRSAARFTLLLLGGLGVMATVQTRLLVSDWD